MTPTHQETPESLDQDLNGSPTPPHTGALGSGGHGYNETETITQPPATTRLGRGFYLGLLAFLIVLAILILYGLHTRSAATTTLGTETKSDAIPEVKIVYPTGASAAGSLVLPGSTQAYVDTPIYSRTSGYLQHWYFDIGAHVKKGQLMATIETPELDQQLQVAEADLKASQANLDLANTTSKRYQDLLKSNSVSHQETDVAVGDARAKQAAVEASMAAVRRLQQLQGFEKVYAPFSGVVTARNTDIGALITGGVNSGTSANQLFHLDDISTLRVFVSVPEAYSGLIHDGATATLTLDEFPGQTFTGRITRNAGAIDPASRTLNVEVDVPNPTGSLLPGAYAKVHFDVPSSGHNLTIPSNTIIFRANGTQVGIVRNNKVVLTPVKIAADHGATLEVASGLSVEDALILDPSDSLTTGQQVKIGQAK